MEPRKSFLGGRGMVMLLVVGCGGGGVDRPVPDPCDGVTCAGHGTCAVTAGNASCTCDGGYQAAGLTCVALAGPVISDVTAQDITQTSAKIGWTLNEPATGQVDYGTTIAYGQQSAKETSFSYSSHLQPLSGLTPATLYHFRVRSSNQAGVESVSGDYTFTTLEDIVPAGCAPAPTSPLVVNVKDTGATGDGSTDDTAAIQVAVDQVAGTGGTVLVPDGTYLINGIADGWSGIRLKGSMTLRMTSGAILKAIPQVLGHYAVIRAQDVSGVNIVGGTVQGERVDHLGPKGPDIDPQHPTGQTGHAIAINGASNNIWVDGVTVKDAWGDGIMLGDSAVSPTNVTICNVLADNNRRQGLSITAADGVVVRESIFKNTNGTPPEAGIDIEPNGSSLCVDHVQVLNSQLLNNAGNQLDVFTMTTPPIYHVVIDGNTLDSVDSEKDGIRLRSANGVTVSNNQIVTAGYGITMYLSTGNTITENTITAGKAPFAGDVGGSTYSGNTCNGNPCP
jgi:parallel beta-helix repeat protein